MTGGEMMFDLVPPSGIEISAVSETSFRVEWNRVEGAEYYEVTVARDMQLDDGVVPYIDLRENGLGINVINLQSSTTYYVSIRSVINGEESSLSNPAEVTTLSEPDPEPDTALKDVATTFAMGMAVRSSWLTGQHDAVLRREYNSLTAEFEMKMNIMYPSEGRFDFSRVDAIVDYAEANDMHVHGHALIWHAATPDWVENFSGTDEEFEEMVEDYIKTTVSRYQGRVRSWDVVNEAFDDGSGNLRNTVFLRRMGSDYIEKCYRWTREADPDVLIFYNDYNMVIDDTKRGAAVAMIDDFIARDVPVDGFGFQMHISYQGPSKSKIASTAKEITDRGLLLHFSELDIRANPNNNISSLSEERAELQKAKYKEVTEVYNSIPDQSKFALTIWGMRDNESWLLDFWGHIDWPLLYDEQFNIKKAHTGILEGLE